MSPATKKTDTQLQQDVLRELRWDTRIRETEVGVEVDDAVVTLTGTVDSWAKRIASQEAAHRVAGVLDVANNVEVRISDQDGRSDTEIARAVREGLEWDVFVPHEQIKSTVSNGQVTLEGEVETWTQREDAGRTVRNLAGVRSVINRIEVQPPKVKERDVRQAIEGALERQAEREARDLKLEIAGGRVKISGRVHSWAEREAVLGAARGTRGVRSVDHTLKIQPYAD